MGKQSELARLRERVAYLESLLKCSRCGHLRNEHDEGDGEFYGPCYGGRTEDMAVGEGEYCMCSGFESEADSSSTLRRQAPGGRA